MQTEVKNIRKELKTGIHLVSITDASLVKGADKKPLLTKDNETGINICFTDANQKNFDKVFWINGPRHKEFLKMLNSAGIPSNATSFKAEAKGKRLWIYIKEVWDIDGEEIIKNELDEPVVNYYIFDYSPVLNPENRPAMSGDPAINGRPGGKFLDYRQIEKASFNVTIEEENFPDEPIVEKAPKVSALQPNTDFVKEPEPTTPEASNKETEIDFDNF